MEVEERPSALGVRAPIIGYEVIEQREKFTVIKVKFEISTS